MRRLRRRAAASAPASPLTPEAATAELRITGLSHRWANGQTVLDDCNLVIPKPGLWMLVGCNGSGKSTLFRLIAGLIEPQSGSIITDHRSALVFQNPDHQLLLPSCSSDLLLGMDQGLGNSERRERIRLRLEELGLAGLERRPIHALSGGQKQRLAIAGALASEASLLLLDEPTALRQPSLGPERSKSGPARSGTIPAQMAGRSNDGLSPSRRMACAGRRVVDTLGSGREHDQRVGMWRGDRGRLF